MAEESSTHKKQGTSGTHMSLTMSKLSLLQKTSNAVLEVVHGSINFCQTTPNSQIVLSLPASLHVAVNAASLFSVCMYM